VACGLGIKVQRRKVLDHDPRLPQRADKILVKHFVERTLGPNWITPTVWHGAWFPSLPNRNWPLPFVLKANHGSAMNIFVRQPSDLDWAKIESQCAKFLARDTIGLAIGVTKKFNGSFGRAFLWLGRSIARRLQILGLRRTRPIRPS
jgi:hypothetical protein